MEFFKLMLRSKVYARSHSCCKIVKRTLCSKIPDIPEHLIRTGGTATSTVQSSTDDEEQFRKAMRKVPQQVVVVTSAEYDASCDTWRKRGVTCSSFTSVSFSPPIVSFCLNKHSRMHELLQRTEQFAVHVLGQDQLSHGVHFSNTAAEDVCQFEKVPHFQSDQGLPIILESLAVMLCGVHSVHTVGDHHVWYGTVSGVSVSESSQDPLIYFTKSFRSVGDEIFLKAFEDATLPFEDWTHQAHIRMAWNYIREYGPNGSIPYIKLGIQKFNEQNKAKIKVGYHETITMFFIHMVWDAMRRCLTEEFDEFLGQSRHLVDETLLFQYYNKDTIFQPEAKLRFIPPDKKPLPAF